MGQDILSNLLLELKQLGALKLTESKKSWIVLLLGVLIFAGFQFYRPLTYYEPIDDASFKKRMILPVWDLRCVNCERESKFALPISGGK